MFSGDYAVFAAAKATAKTRSGCQLGVQFLHRIHVEFVQVLHALDSRLGTKMVVKVVTRASSDEVRIARESAIALRRSSTVLMTMTISLFLIMSTMCGRPSVTFVHHRHRHASLGNRGCSTLVATSSKPRATSWRAMSTARGLSLFFTVKHLA